MTHCCVPLCRSTRSKGGGTAFHEFPTDMKRRVAWLANMPSRGDENDIEPWIPTDRSAICSKHFLPADYKIGLKKPRLLPYAVPSVFPDHPNHGKSNIVQLCRTSTPAQKLDLTVKETRIVAGSPYNPEAQRLPILLRRANISRPIKTVAPSEDQHVSSVGFEPAMLLDDAVLTKDKGTVTKLTMGDMCSKARKYRSARQRLKYLRAKMAAANSASFQQDNISLRHKLAKYKIEELEKARDCGDRKAMFLLEQLVSFTCKKRKRWSENTMRCCGAWHSKFSASYAFVRAVNILTLPSRSALRRMNVGSVPTAPEHG